MSHFRKFFDIVKVDEEKQSVWGYASTPTLDSDDEIVTLDAIKGALPDYLEWGNIREMHKNSAVGVAIEADVHVDEKGLWIGARVVDPIAWQKVKEKVYKGFSIGGNIVRKVGKKITEMTLVEISLVDRPANTDCKFEVIKRSKDEGDVVTEGVVMLKSLDLLRAIHLDGTNAATDEEISGARKFINAVLRVIKADSSLSSPEAVVKPLSAEGHTDPPGVGIIEGVTQDLPENKADSGKPYGDVAYADPGHQADGKHRYPIDTPRHIRSAWSYIHKPSNRTPYTAQQLSSIEGAITAAWKEHIDKDGPPEASKAASLVEQDDAEWADIVADLDPIFAKGMHGVGRLSYAFNDIREVQRKHIFEGHVEGDPEDEALATRMGAIAEELAKLIADVAIHEGSEAITLSDIDDITWRPDYPYGGIAPTFSITETFEMPKDAAAQAAELAKRGQTKAHHMGKASNHMAECMKCQKSMMSHINSLHDLHKSFAVGSKEAAATAKAAPEFPHAAAMTHMHGIMTNHMKAQDHSEMAHGHLSLCAGAGMESGTDEGEWGGTHVEGTTPPKGGDPLNDGTGTKAVEANTITKGEMEAREQAAYWKGQAEAMAKLPAQRGGAAPLLFNSAGAYKSASVGEAPTDAEKMMDGVTMTDPTDPNQAAKAAGRMIGNMIAGGMGKNPVLDPTFRGGAGA